MGKRRKIKSEREFAEFTVLHIEQQKQTK
ncbi:MAG: hypothetical protein RLZZ381_787, partial [Cyanobacteriota bacterium]